MTIETGRMSSERVLVLGVHSVRSLMSIKCMLFILWNKLQPRMASYGTTVSSVSGEHGGFITDDTMFRIEKHQQDLLMSTSWNQIFRYAFTHSSLNTFF